jgi:sporulation protein YlmC with PRC-barrel domain
MAHYGTLQDFRFSDLDTADDIRGSAVYDSQSEKVGKIDDVIFDHATGNVHYVVVDTRGRLSNENFIIPPDRLRASSKHKDAFQINQTKKQIESLPPYKEDDVQDENRWKDYEERYKASWAHPVQHREDSDHNVTPTPDEMPVEPGSIGSRISAREQAELSSRITPATGNEVTIENSAAGIGSRWLTFEDRLRQHRRDITRRCTTCTVGPASDRGEESAADQRKAV